MLGNKFIGAIRTIHGRRLIGCLLGHLPERCPECQFLTRLYRVAHNPITPKFPCRSNASLLRGETGHKSIRTDVAIHDMSPARIVTRKLRFPLRITDIRPAASSRPRALYFKSRMTPHSARATLDT